jgi:SAM-dependent methyltransferase
LQDRKDTANNQLYDFGCGPGHFLDFARQQGWSVTGSEPATSAIEFASKEYNLDLYTSLDEVRENEQTLFDVIVSFNVVEHLRDPVSVIRSLRELLPENGLLAIRVPNDFSAIQEAAHKKVGGKKWWIAIPDHINYFSFESLSNLLNREGFDVIDQIGDFPMELFLLMGEDYTTDPSLGKECHAKRVELEHSMPGELRRNLYRSFASSNIGRNILMVAKKKI